MAFIIITIAIVIAFIMIAFTANKKEEPQAPEKMKEKYEKDEDLILKKYGI